MCVCVCAGKCLRCTLCLSRSNASASLPRTAGSQNRPSTSMWRPPLFVPSFDSDSILVCLHQSPVFSLRVFDPPCYPSVHFQILCRFSVNIRGGKKGKETKIKLLYFVPLFVCTSVISLHLPNSHRCAQTPSRRQQTVRFRPRKLSPGSFIS